MAAFADDLKRIAMSAELARSLSRAADYARAQGLDQIQLEHLLLALTEDPDAAVVLTASHVDTGLLKADVAQYLGGLTEQMAPSGLALAVAPDLRRILEAAAAAASHGRRSDINGAIVLAAIVGDGKSPSAHMLRAQGLTFEEAIRALQQTIAAPQPAAPARIAPPEPEQRRPGTEDHLAAARARINQSRGAVGSRAVAEVRPPDVLTQPFAAPDPAQEWPPAVRSSAEPNFEPEAPGYSAGDLDPGAWQSGQPEPYLADASSQGSESPGSDPLVHHGNVGWNEHELPEPSLNAASQDPPYYEQLYEPPYEPPAHAYPADADRLQPPLPRLRPQAPQPGSRWPAPVAPAWRDTGSPGSGGYAPAPGPPPLPPSVVPFDTGAAHGADDGAAFQRNNGAEDDGYYTRAGAALDAGYRPEALPREGYPLQHPDAPQPRSFEADAHGNDERGRRMDPARHGGEDSSPPALQPAAGTPRGRRGRKPNEAVTRALAEALPRRMRMLEPTLIEVVLLKSEIHAIAVESRNGQASAGQASVALSVRLRAPEWSFIIDPASSETQWLEAHPDVIQSEHVLWHWTVTPLKAGRTRLQLVAAVRAPLPDGAAIDHMLPDTIADVSVRRGFGRVLLGFGKWVSVATVGAALALYGAPVLRPLIEAAVKLIK